MTAQISPTLQYEVSSHTSTISFYIYALKIFIFFIYFHQRRRIVAVTVSKGDGEDVCMETCDHAT